MSTSSKVYSGRVDRKTYIYGLFFLFFCMAVLTDLVTAPFTYMNGNIVPTPLPELLIYLYRSIDIIAILSFSLLTVRRFHDVNKKGANFFLLLIPLYNLFVLASLFTAKGTESENKYGRPIPKKSNFLKVIFNYKTV